MIIKFIFINNKEVRQQNLNIIAYAVIQSVFTHHCYHFEARFEVLFSHLVFDTLSLVRLKKYDFFNWTIRVDVHMCKYVFGQTQTHFIPSTAKKYILPCCFFLF